MADGNLFDTLQDISDAVTQATKTGNYADLPHSIQDRVKAFAKENSWQHMASGNGQSADSWQHMASGNGQGAHSDNDYGANSGSSTSRTYDRTAEDRTANAGRQTYSGSYGRDTATYAKMEELRREKEKEAQRRAEAAGAERGQEEGQQAASYFLQTRPDRNRGQGLRIGGLFGAVFFGFCTIWNVLCFCILLASRELAAVSVFFVALLGLTGWLTWKFVRMYRKGKRQRILAQLYYQYAGIIGDKAYCEIEALASLTGESKTQVCQNLRDMKNEGMLNILAFDKNKTTAMFTKEAIRQYKDAEAGRKEREEAQKKENSQQKGKEKDRTLSAEVQEILSEGNNYIREIREINDRIPDTEGMSDKLYRLEDIMKRIFAQVRKTPSKAKDIRKLMRYYLPTTLKLLRAYADLEGQSDAGDNIRATRREIEESMDTINDAFEKMLDELFQEQAWDLSSDLHVMKTMLQQDGLVEEKREKDMVKVPVSSGYSSDDEKN